MCAPENDLVYKEWIDRKRDELWQAMATVVRQLHVEWMTKTGNVYDSGKYLCLEAADCIFLYDNNPVMGGKSHHLSLAWDSPGKISYAEKPQDKYSYQRRKITKFGRYLKRHTQMSNVPDAVVNYVASETMAIVNRETYDDCISIVSGQAICDAYRDEFGESSCMTRGDGSIVELYAENADKVQLVKFDDGRLQARALLWTTDDGTQLLDRMYPNDGYHVPILCNWAQQNGIYYREDNGGDPVGFIDTDGKPVDDEFCVTLDATEKCPYMDTFKWGEWLSRGRIQVWNRDGITSELFFETTDGSWPHIEFCEHCGESCDPDDTFSSVDGLICRSCRAFNYCACRNCEEIIHNDDITESDNGFPYCDRCYYYLFTECADCRNEIKKSDAEYFDGDLYCSDCVPETAES